MFSIVDTDFTSYSVSSYLPNVSCCEGGTFLLENNVFGSINSTSLSNTPIEGESSFDLTIEDFNDGMNYTTIQISNGFGLFFYSIQFYFDSTANEVDYLNIMHSTQSETDFVTALFKYNYYTNSNINILIELESGIREEPFRSIMDGEGEFRYISSSAGTNIFKSTREKI